MAMYSLIWPLLFSTLVLNSFQNHLEQEAGGSLSFPAIPYNHSQGIAATWVIRGEVLISSASIATSVSDIQQNFQDLVVGNGRLGELGGFPGFYLKVDSITGDLQWVEFPKNDLSVEHDYHEEEEVALTYWILLAGGWSDHIRRSGLSLELEFFGSVFGSGDLSPSGRRILLNQVCSDLYQGSSILTKFIMAIGQNSPIREAQRKKFVDAFELLKMKKEELRLWRAQQRRQELVVTLNQYYEAFTVSVPKELDRIRSKNKK